METIMLNAAETTFKFKTAFLFLSMALLLSFNSMSQEKPAIGADPVYVNYLKVQDGQLFFTIRYINTGGRRFDILINDVHGENLYRGNFKAKEFGKVFQAPVELGKLLVTIRSYGDKTDHKFEITSEARMVQETYVTAMRQ